MLVLNGVWRYLDYRREYRNYLSIAAYLEEFEKQASVVHRYPIPLTFLIYS